MSVSKSVLILVGSLALAVAGCSSISSQTAGRAPDWEELGKTNTLAAPPETTPAQPQPSSVAAVPTPQPTPLPRTNAPKPQLPAPALTQGWVSLRHWSKASGLPAPARIANSSFSSYELRGTNGVLLLRPGSQIGYWDGMELRLGFAPQMLHGEPYVHALDLKKTVQPLLQGPAVLPLNPSPVIVIDPGHGGENAGTRSVLGPRYEKEYTLDWARRLQALLVTNGCQVFLTRSGDTDLALSNRVSFAEEHKADVFISLHFNSAAPNQTQTGLETYFLTPVGMPSTLVRGFADEVGTTFPNNNFDVQNFQLALEIHRALLEANGHHDRGVRHARFPGVLRNQQRPAILVEGGYLSNPQEARLVDEPAYRQKLAEAVAKALLQSIVRPVQPAAIAASGEGRVTGDVVKAEAPAKVQVPKPEVTATAVPAEPQISKAEVLPPVAEVQSTPLPEVQAPAAETQSAPSEPRKPKRQIQSPKSKG